eukprot:CAMPEP_0201600438 /NCGR_PEP_ID=MMETSP0492-20130828/1492_1 /ASSEMBLY_ACC=CAM_ASM_000837 /TAXON_ID=420259 /ORGANISM="Thalassiosira gravida, Strain GMp14c1" /LENGTH=130 /DNA_ID=CAMNT_0048063173 /DNA_START=21 /DNA_END=410 /DNA_ORIENTATION=-
MKSSHNLSISLLVLVCVACSSDAFAIHRNRAQNSILQRYHPPKPNIITPSPQSSIHRRTRDDGSIGSRTPSIIIPLAKNDKNSNVEEKKKEYSKVEDGSPLGVAIVLLGSLYIFNSGDESFQDPTSSSVW